MVVKCLKCGSPEVVLTAKVDVDFQFDKKGGIVLKMMLRTRFIGVWSMDQLQSSVNAQFALNISVMMNGENHCNKKKEMMKFLN